MSLRESGTFGPSAKPSERTQGPQELVTGWVVIDRSFHWIVVAAASRLEAIARAKAEGEGIVAAGEVACCPLEEFVLHVSPHSGTYTTRALLLRVGGEEFFWSDGDAPRPVPTRPRPFPRRFWPFPDPDAVFAAMPIPEYRRTRVRPGQRWLEVQRPGRTA